VLPVSREFPDGTVTFVMTDVVGSTESWEQSPREMRQAMVLHDQLVEAVVEAHSGMLVRPRGEGDSRFAVFRRASDAVAATAAVVEAMEEAEWSTPEPIRVRVGVHTGEADLRDGDYYGTAVNLCARIRGLAEPNRVLISEATSRLLMRSDSMVQLHEVGAYDLKGISLPERVFSLGVGPAVGRPRERGRPRSNKPPTDSRPPRPAWRSRRFWGAVTLVLVGAVLALVISSGSGPKTPTMAAPPPLPRGYTPRFAKGTCAKSITSELATASCGWLIVPQNRAHPKSGPKVRVAVTIAPPLAGVKPGASPTIDIGGADSLDDSPARASSEFIEVTPRGQDPDTPALTCPAVNDVEHRALTQPSDDPASDSAVEAAFSSCYARLVKSGIDPGSYTYDSMADDVVDLMAVLHIGKADIVTDDNLSHVAFGVLEKAPGSVRTLTLDDPEPPGDSANTDPVSYLASSFQRYASLCDVDTNCASEFPNLAQTYQTQLVRFEHSPVVAQTEGLSPNVNVLVDGDRLAEALQEALASSIDFQILAAGVAQAPTGLIARLADYDAGTVQVDPAWGLDLSMLCSYDKRTVSVTAALSAKQLPAFVGVLGDPSISQLCSSWKVPVVPDFYFQGIASLVPTLIVQGTLTPFGDVSWPDDVKQSLQAATVGQFATLSESVLEFAPPCLAELRRQFLANPAGHLDMASCTAQSPPIHFVDTP
jgi:class 3 adenylate cyclase/pimeloyl-ACP methyl ester carboxylesterase